MSAFGAKRTFGHGQGCGAATAWEPKGSDILLLLMPAKANPLRR